MKQHHPKYPVSSMMRRKLCPGSAGAEFGLPELKTSGDADEGNLLHDAVAQMILTGQMPPKLDAEQMESVEKCFNVFKSAMGDNSWPMMIEAMVKIANPHKNNEELTFGTIDAAIIKENEIVLFDWKMGREMVESPKNNLQLATYAVGLHNIFPEKSSVSANIFQPRINSFASHTFTEFDNILVFIANVIAECEKSDAMRIAGEEQCKYCKARATCPECLELLKQLPAVIPPCDIASPDVLYDLWRRARRAEKIVEAIKAACRSYAEQNGGKCGNLTLEKGRVSREISDLNQAYVRLSGLMTNQEFVSCIKGLSLPEAEGVISKKYGITKKDAKTKIEETLGDLLSTKEGNKVFKDKGDKDNGEGDI
jgi:hypothetical protein